MCETGVVRPQQGCEQCGQECRGHGAAGLAACGARLRGRQAKKDQDLAQDRQQDRQGRGQGRAKALGQARDGSGQGP